MKKAIQFMLLAALVVSVSGCANTNHPQAIRESSDIEALRSEIDENAVPKETLTDSFSESKTSSDDSVIDVKAETESSQAETPQPTAEQSPALGIQSPQTVVSNDTPKPESSKAVEPTTEPKPTPTQQPTQQQAEEKPTPEPALNHRRKPRRPQNLPHPTSISTIGSVMREAMRKAWDCGLKVRRLTAGTIPSPQEHTALALTGTLKAG